MSNTLLTTTHLHFSYGEKKILENISFTIKERDFVGIIGANGGGKTTLIKLILGLLKPEQGLIRISGKKPGRRPHHIAYLPQSLQFDSQIPITVEEVVLMGCLGHRFLGRYSKYDRARAEKAMKSMNVFDLKSRFFSALSGGQKQRVLIARAITCHPKLLLLDEPTTGIDSHHEQILMELLKELNQSMAIAMVSHEYNLVSSLVDYVLCVNKTAHIHHPHEITAENFQNLISKKYQFVIHDHHEDRY